MPNNNYIGLTKYTDNNSKIFYKVNLFINEHRISLGYFRGKIDAAMMYDSCKLFLYYSQNLGEKYNHKQIKLNLSPDYYTRDLLIANKSDTKDADSYFILFKYYRQQYLDKVHNNELTKMPIIIQDFDFKPTKYSLDEINIDHNKSITFKDLFFSYMHENITLTRHSHHIVEDTNPQLRSKKRSLEVDSPFADNQSENTASKRQKNNLNLITTHSLVFSSNNDASNPLFNFSQLNTKQIIEKTKNMRQSANSITNEDAYLKAISRVIGGQESVNSGISCILGPKHEFLQSEHSSTASNFYDGLNELEPSQSDSPLPLKVRSPSPDSQFSALLKELEQAPINATETVNPTPNQVSNSRSSSLWSSSSEIWKTINNSDDCGLNLLATLSPDPNNATDLTNEPNNDQLSIASSKILGHTFSLCQSNNQISSPDTLPHTADINFYNNDIGLEDRDTHSIINNHHKKIQQSNTALFVNLKNINYRKDRKYWKASISLVNSSVFIAQNNNLEQLITDIEKSPKISLDEKLSKFPELFIKDKEGIIRLKTKKERYELQTNNSFNVNGDIIIHDKVGARKGSVVNRKHTNPVIFSKTGMHASNSNTLDKIMRNRLGNINIG